MLSSSSEGDSHVPVRSNSKTSVKQKLPERPAPKRVFATMADAGARLYRRARDLPKLIALWPRELADESPEGRLHVLGKLRRALRAERRRAVSGHWSYDLNRHLGLLSAYKAELAALGCRHPRVRLNRIADGDHPILVGNGDSVARLRSKGHVRTGSRNRG